jgi:hypothetical protein
MILPGTKYHIKQRIEKEMQLNSKIWRNSANRLEQENLAGQRELLNSIVTILDASEEFTLQPETSKRCKDIIFNHK